MILKREVRIAGVTSFGGQRNKDSVPKKGAQSTCSKCGEGMNDLACGDFCIYI